MKKLLLLELIFLVTAAFLTALLIKSDLIFHSTFFLAAFFALVVVWYENKEKNLGRGVLLGFVSGFLWGFISLSIQMLAGLAMTADLITDESRLIGQLNTLKLENYVGSVAGLTPGGLLIIGVVFILVLVTVTGGVAGLLSTVVVRYLKGSKSRK